MDWVLIILCLAASGEVTSGSSLKSMTLPRCEAEGLAEVAKQQTENAGKYASVVYVCMSKTGEKPPKRLNKPT